MKKSLKNKLYLKQRLYSHYLIEGTCLRKSSCCFKEIIAELEILEVKYDKKDLGLIFLCLLSTLYMSFKDTILYSCDTLTIEKVYNILFSKKKMKHSVELEVYIDELVDDDDVRGTSKFNFNDQICNHHKKKGHIKDCYKIQNQEKWLQIIRESNQKF